MPTPYAVKEAASRVDEMIRQGYEQSNAMDTAQQEAPDPQDTEDEVADATDDQTNDEGVSSDQGVEQPQPQPQQQPAQAEIAELQKRAELWEQRYRSLNGMIESRDRQIESLHQLMARMEAAPPQPREPAQAQPAEPAITKEDVDSFGDDLIDLARRVARSEYSEHEQRMQQRIKELEAQLSGVAEQTNASAQDQFLAKLKTRVANLEQINTDPKFVQWLQESPTRQQMFNTAVQQMDVPGTAWFFESWASEHNQPAPPSQPDPRLARQVAPGKSRSAPSPAQSQDGQKRSWTRSAIVEFYKNIGKYPQKERDRIERDIALAQKEGRVDFTK